MAVVTPMYKAYSLSHEDFECKLCCYHGRMLYNYVIVKPHYE